MHQMGRSFLPVSVVLVMGLSACGPVPSDPAPSVESRASRSGLSEPHPVSLDSPSSMNGGTQKGTQVSVVVPENPNDDASIEQPDQDVIFEMEPLEDQTEPEERAREQEKQ